MLPPNHRYTLQDIEANFSEPVLRAAPALIDSITAAEAGNDGIWCELRGKGGARLEVEIFLDEFELLGKTQIGIESECSCSTEENCAHAAAALLFMLEQRAAGSPAVREPVVNPGLLLWVDTLRKASQTSAKKP